MQLGELDLRFSSEDASPVAWSDASEQLAKAEVYWLSTVRPDGRPHVTPLLAIWRDEAMYFCTGPTERKARNLEHNQHCVITTGCNSLGEGYDVVVEGDAAPITDDATLQDLADAYESKYGKDWHFDVQDGAFHAEGGEALVFKVAPKKVLGFGRGEPYSQTRWRF